MDPKAILDLYDQDMRKDCPAGRATIHQRSGLTYFVVPPPSPRRGWVIYTRLDAAEADGAIEDTIEFFRQLGGQFEWKVYDHDAPVDLKERLAGHGFVPEDLEAVLAFDMESAPSSFWESGSADVRRITDPAQLSQIADIETEVWGESFAELQATLGAEMQATPNGISVYVAYSEGRPVSGAWTRFYQGRQFAELYGGATIPSQRGKGLYTALVQRRAREARQRGVRFLVVDTSPMSRPILEKRGFVFLTHAQAFVMEFR